jgi:hypothetical protein
MKLFKLLVLALSYILFLAPTAVQAVDCICDAVWDQCVGFDTQGSCCAGHLCVGNLYYAQCRVEPSLTTGMGCTAVWELSPETQECDCCPGNYCEQMDSGGCIASPME